MSLLCAQELQPEKFYLLKEKKTIIDRISNLYIDSPQLFFVVNIDVNSKHLRQKCVEGLCDNPDLCSKQHRLLLSSNDQESFVLICSNDHHSWYKAAFEQIS